MKWNDAFPTHKTTELQIATYLEAFDDFTAVDLDTACREATREAEQFPKPGHIREAWRKVKSIEYEQFLGPRQLSYPPISEEERDAAIAEQSDFVAKLKEQLGNPQALPQAEARNVQAGPFRSVAEQKKILERRGFLVPGASHSPACLCPDCRMRREQTT